MPCFVVVGGGVTRRHLCKRSTPPATVAQYVYRPAPFVNLRLTQQKEEESTEGMSVGGGERRVLLCTPWLAHAAALTASVLADFSCPSGAAFRLQSLSPLGQRSNPHTMEESPLPPPLAAAPAPTGSDAPPPETASLLSSAPPNVPWRRRGAQDGGEIDEAVFAPAAAEGGDGGDGGAAGARVFLRSLSGPGAPQEESVLVFENASPRSVR